MISLARFAVIGAVAAISMGIAGPALAEFPEKPIRLIIPFGAGGGTDTLARKVQQVIEDKDLLPVPLVLVNQDAAGGIVAYRTLRDAEPDGYTLLQVHDSMLAAMATDKVDFGIEVYEPVAQLSRMCAYLAVVPDLPIETMEDFVEYAKENPGSLKTSETPGGPNHFSLLNLQEQTGAEFGIVPGSGTSQRYASMKGGHTQFGLMSPGWLERAADDLRAVAWFAPEAASAAPDMPTAREEGYPVNACFSRRWWAPEGTPEERIEVIAEAVRAAMETPEMQEYIAQQGEEARVLTGEELKAQAQEDFDSYANVADAAKAQMEE